MSSEVAQLLRRPGYARYFTTVATARAFGTMFTVSGVLLVLERTGNIALAGIVAGAASLPGAFTGPVLGAWLDVTSSRRRLLVFDRVATVVALVLLVLLAGRAPNWTLPVVAVLYGIGSPLSSGSFASVLPELAGPLSGVAYTFEATSINIAFIIGPALAGAIAGAAGAAAAIWVQVGASLIVGAAITLDGNFELRPPDAVRPARLRSAIGDGLRAMWSIVPLRRNIAAGTVYVTAWGTLVVGFPALAVYVGASASAAGYLWAAVSAGSMVSAFALRRFAEARSWRVVVGVSFLAMAISALAWPLAPSLLVAAALVALTGILEGPSLVALISVRQALAPAHLRGNVFSSVVSFNLAAGAVGSALAGPLQKQLGQVASIYAFAALLAASALIALVGRDRPNRVRP